MDNTHAPSLENLRDIAIDAAHAGGGALLDRQDDPERGIRRKVGLDIVTEADQASETAILSRLSATTPAFQISSEEAGTRGPTDSDYSWMVDPLDGTINYTTGLPLYSVSVALLRSGTPLVGVVYVPSVGQTYSAVRGSGAECNGGTLGTAEKTELADAVLSFMLTSHYDAALRDWTLAVIAGLAPVARGLRLFVSQALELALVASGSLHGTVCNGTHGFSSAAGALIVSEAGGVVTDLEGHRYSPGTSSSLVAAATSSLSAALLDELRKVPSLEEEVSNAGQQ
jgi:myo-inositol-1(or 4)-monophosphatase